MMIFTGVDDEFFSHSWSTSHLVRLPSNKMFKNLNIVSTTIVTDIRQTLKTRVLAHRRAQSAQRPVFRFHVTHTNFSPSLQTRQGSQSVYNLRSPRLQN